MLSVAGSVDDCLPMSCFIPKEPVNPTVKNMAVNIGVDMLIGFGFRCSECHLSKFRIEEIIDMFPKFGFRVRYFWEVFKRLLNSCVEVLCI